MAILKKKAEDIVNLTNNINSTTADLVLRPNNSGCNLSLKAWGWIESKKEGNSQ